MRTASKNTVERLNDAIELLKTECDVHQNDILGITVMDTGYMSFRLAHDAYTNVLIHEGTRVITITNDGSAFDYLTFRNISIHKAH
jgi:hypothetical protein